MKQQMPSAATRDTPPATPTPTPTLVDVDRPEDVDWTVGGEYVLLKVDVADVELFTDVVKAELDAGAAVDTTGLDAGGVVSV